MTVTDTALRGVPLFSGMTDRALDAISELVSQRTFETDEDLVREDEPGDSFLVISAGWAIVLKDESQLSQLGPGATSSVRSRLSTAALEPPPCGPRRRSTRSLSVATISRR